MGVRLATSLAVAILAIAALASTASAQQISPGGPDSQVSEYILPETEIGPLRGGDEVPSLGGPGPSGDVGGSGNLPFTGMWLLPLAALGITLALAGVAVRRRRAGGPAPA